jgi:transposase
LAAGLTNRLPVVGGLASDRGASRQDLAVVWLERGVSAGQRKLKSDMPTMVCVPDDEGEAVAVMIGVDPHKGSHTAVAIDQAGRVLGQVRVRAAAAQAEQLVAWAAGRPERIWAVEGDLQVTLRNT